jgi:hypothetical protein
MGWVYLIGEHLDAMNIQRRLEGRQPLTWGDVKRLTGINDGLLRNLENNSELKATNTRFLDSLCRFFACGVDSLVSMVPDRPEQPDHNSIDRFLNHDLVRGVQPGYHVDLLYGEDAQRWWRENRDLHRPIIRRR